MKLKRIGFVLSFLPDYSETFLSSKIEGLVEYGHSVVVYTDYIPKNIEHKNFSIISGADWTVSNTKKLFLTAKYVFFSLFKSPRRSYQLYKLNKKDGFDFRSNIINVIKNQNLLRLEVDWLHFGFGSLIEGRENVAKAIGAKCGLSFRGYDLYLSPLLRPNCFDLAFSKEIKYHVLSEQMKLHLLEKGINEKRISVIPPAIDSNYFKPLEARIKNKTNQFLTVARLHWKKGLEYTLEALSLLKESGLDFQYKIIGEGDQYERLVFAAYQLGLKDKIEFLGKCSKEEVRNYMAQADIYLQYSIQEGFCNAVLEAQAMELLCLVSNAEGLEENIVHQKTGWVVPKRKPGLLADQIIQVLGLDEKSKTIIKRNARKRVVADFNLEFQNLKFLEFYGE
ncbi:glycosyltransferase family 4 protein [Aegicerativicinus sediminis]|uniref:glycosyltransferase family 4 protein n=1 Tax=Aegicerativicinus sediminis TaxID=2893202 RepID=UPI001E40EFD6|nr:glycosyltransferase family 4 protein [Aegicerativicinus sediminis]